MAYESMTSLCLFKEIECLHVHFLLLIHKTLQHLKQSPFGNLPFGRTQMGHKNELKQTGPQKSGATMKLASLHGGQVSESSRLRRYTAQTISSYSVGFTVSTWVPNKNAI